MSEAPEYGVHWGQVAYVCPRCGALVYYSDEAKAGHEAFHAAIADQVPSGLSRETNDGSSTERPAP